MQLRFDVLTHWAPAIFARRSTNRLTTAFLEIVSLQASLPASSDSVADVEGLDDVVVEEDDGLVVVEAGSASAAPAVTPDSAVAAASADSVRVRRIV